MRIVVQTNFPIDMAIKFIGDFTENVSV